MVVKYMLSVDYYDFCRLYDEEEWDLVTFKKSEAKKFARQLFREGVDCEVSLYVQAKEQGTSFQGTAYSVEDVKKW